MDYEKEYYEIVRRARELHESGNELTKKQMEIVCPQLAESEDERIMQCIEVALTDVDEQRFKDFGTTLKECLAYLEKQKEQKPAERSEEDEKMLSACIEAVGSMSVRSDVKTLRDWLKSLRPSWKPSEEQISALEYFIRAWGESGSMSPQNPVLCAAKSLLTDLQKL